MLRWHHSPAFYGPSSLLSSLAFSNILFVCSSFVALWCWNGQLMHSAWLVALTSESIIICVNTSALGDWVLLQFDLPLGIWQPDGDC